MKRAGVVILPLPGAGHLVSALEFAKRLNELYQFAIVVINIKMPSASSEFPAPPITASALDIRFIDLPAVEEPKTQTLEAFISQYIANYRSHVKGAILNLVPELRVTAMIIDFFATAVMDVAEELGIPAYIYFASTAACLALMLHLPTLDVKISSEFSDLDEAVDVPGLGAVPPLVMPAPVMSKKSDGYSWFVRHGWMFRRAKGLIINTFEELEAKVLEAMRRGDCMPDHSTPAVHPVGPLLVLHERDESNACIQWLDLQPQASVVFLCFGSMGSFPVSQLREIALGLERSGLGFLWCLRAQRHGGHERTFDALPEGFLDRTKGRGLVWPGWAAQTAILSHEAVGGFVSHCGWNSSLESMWFGVPMLAWPLYAEQRLNAHQLSRDVGVALELGIDYRDGEWITAEEVELGLRRLMEKPAEATKVRCRAREMAAASRAAVQPGGSSSSTLTRLAQELLSDSRDL